MPEPATTIAGPRLRSAPFLALEAISSLPTPAYVYDLAEIRRNTSALRRALPEQATLYYSLKANPHPAVLGAVREADLAAEVCSRGEVDAALAAGFPPGQLLLTGPGKRDCDVRRALRAGVRWISVDTPAGLLQAARCAEETGTRARCLLRVNDDQPAHGQGLTMTGVPSQFGADTAWILAEPSRFTGSGRAPVVGLHLYMGTNLASVADLAGQFAGALRTAEHVAAALARAGAEITVFDLGGGFGAPFARDGGRMPLDGLRERLDGMLAGHGLDGRQAAFESGRYLTATAGTLLCQVLDVKTSHGQAVAVLDAGINHLGGMSGLRRLPPLAPRVLALAPAGDPRPTRICGPLCTPLDTWASSALLPPLSPGQLVAVPNVGAYGLYASLVAFLGHPMPVEVVVDSDQPEDPVREISQLELTRRVPTT